MTFKKLLAGLVLAAFVCVSFAQSPGTAITVLPAAATLTGSELMPAAQSGSGGSCVGGYCGVAITPNQILALIGSIGSPGGVLYFPGGSTLGSSATLATNQLVLGGGTGSAPFTLGSLGTTTTVYHGNAVGAGSFGAVNLTTDVTSDLPVGNGGSGVGTISGVIKGNGTSPFTPAAAPDVYTLFGANGSSTCFLSVTSGTAGCTNPAGSGTVTTTGSPASGNLAKFSGTTSIVNGDLSGDCTTSGTLAITCTKMNGQTVTLGGAFTTSGAFGVTFTATATTNATLPPGNVNLGYLGMPLTGGAVKTASYPFVLADSGTAANFNCSGACTATIPANSSVAYPVGTVLGFHVLCSGTQSLTIAITTDTLYWMPSAGTGSRTVSVCGFATAYKETSTTWAIAGQGVS